jgi:hypothetical protein
MTDILILNIALTGADAMQDYWKEERDGLLEIFPKLNMQRAGEWAAAYLAVIAANEWVVLESDVKYAEEENVATHCYEELQDRSIRGELVDLSGSRTIIEDMQSIEEAERIYETLGLALYGAMRKELP